MIIMPSRKRTSMPNPSVRRRSRRLPEKTAIGLSDFLAGADIPIFFLDLNFRLRCFTPSASRLCGLAAADIGRPIGGIRRLFAAANLLSDARKALAKARTVEREIPDVKGRWFVRRIHPCRAGARRIAGMAVILTDITRSKQAEKTLRAVLDATGESICLFDAEGVVVAANTTAASRIRLAPCEVIGRHYSELLPPCAAALRRKCLHGVVHSKQPQQFEDKHDGRIFEHHFYPILEGGRVTRIVSCSRDITAHKRFEAALRESEERFRSVLDNSRDVIYRFNLRTKQYEYWSPACTYFLGFSPEELALLSYEEILARVHPDDRTGLKAELERSVEAGRGSWTFRFLSKNGHYRWYSNHIAVINGRDGHPLYRDGFVRDVSESKLAETALRESENYYRSLFRNMLNGFAYCKMLFDDENRPLDFIYLDVNQAFHRLTGLENVVGRKVTEIIPGVKESNPELLEIYGRVALSGAPENLETFIPTLETWFSISVYSTEKGTFVAVFDNITDRKRIVEALRESETRLALAQQAGRVGVFDWDLVSGRIVWTEQLETIFGLVPGTFRQQYRDWADRIVPEDLPRMESLFSEWLASARPESRWEYRFRRTDGEIRWMDARARVIRNSDGKPQRMIGTNLDITERKRIEESLRESDRRKDEFLAMLAHELRNPLSPVRISVELIRKQSTDPRLSRWTETIRQQITHLSRILDDLLDISRISRGLITLKKEPVSLVEAVNQAIDNYRAFLDVNQQELQITASGEPMVLNADPVRLVQILSNLLNNASKYSPQGGLIRVLTRREDHSAVIEVADNGVGIPSEILPKIFNLFYQADSSPARTQGGLGLGLTLVKQLTKLHGGTIEAHSEGPGRGSRFTLRLPLRQIISPAGETFHKEKPKRMTTSAELKVLVVEDNTDSAESLCELLQTWGHQVWKAHDGPSGIREAVNVLPDVVLLDIGLPGMDGYEVARRLQQELPPAKTKLVALTGYNPDRLRTAEAGFVAYLTKPVDLDELEELLNQQKH